MNDPITLEDFKRAVAAFHKEAPTASERDLEAGWNAVAKLYLRVDIPDEVTSIQAVACLNFASRRYLEFMTA